MANEVQLIGFDAVENAIDYFGVAMSYAASQAAYDEAVYELGLTQEQVPVGPTGNLKASGRVEKFDADMGGTVHASAIVYGGPAGSGPGQLGDVDYAMPVHENLEAHHPVGKAKYVEDVARAEMSSGRAVGRISAQLMKSISKITSRAAVAIRGKGGRFTGSTGMD